MPKKKLYMAALMAWTYLRPEHTIGPLIECHPYLIVDHSIEGAAEQAKRFAFAHWPVAEGWESHRAAIAPAAGGLYESIALGLQNDEINTANNEIGHTFEFNNEWTNAIFE